MNRQPRQSSPSRNSQPDDAQYKKAVSNVKSMLQAAGVGKSTEPLSERSRRLARELEDFVARGMQGIMATEVGEEGAPSVESATELQIQIARMFRQVRFVALCLRLRLSRVYGCVFGVEHWMAFSEGWGYIE